MFSYSHRATRPELMDDPDVPEADIRLNLQELAVVGKRLGGYAVAEGALRHIMKQGLRLKSIMDMGSGGGDTARAIAGWARRNNLSLAITGVDRNPDMTAFATETSAAYPNLSFITADVMDDALLQQGSFDVVMSSLFCHHFSDEALPALLRRMVALCGTAVVINDLHRHPVAFYSIKVLTAVFSKSYLVKNDAPLSVAKAFRRADWERLFRSAGIRQYTIRWCWAWRWQIIIPSQPLV